MAHRISQKKSDKSPVETDFGIRAISNQNFSKMVALPKTALKNCGCDMDKELKVSVQLVQNGDEKFIKLTPVCNPDMEENGKEEIS